MQVLITKDSLQVLRDDTVVRVSQGYHTSICSSSLGFTALSSELSKISCTSILQYLSVFICPFSLPHLQAFVFLIIPFTISFTQYAYQNHYRCWYPFLQDSLLLPSVLYYWPRLLILFAQESFPLGLSVFQLTHY